MSLPTAREELLIRIAEIRIRQQRLIEDTTAPINLRRRVTSVARQLADAGRALADLTIETQPGRLSKVEALIHVASSRLSLVEKTVRQFGPHATVRRPDELSSEEPPI